MESNQKTRGTRHQMPHPSCFLVTFAKLKLKQACTKSFLPVIAAQPFPCNAYIPDEPTPPLPPYASPRYYLAASPRKAASSLDTHSAPPLPAHSRSAPHGRHDAE